MQHLQPSASLYDQNAAVTVISALGQFLASFWPDLGQYFFLAEGGVGNCGEDSA